MIRRRGEETTACLTVLRNQPSGLVNYPDHLGVEASDGVQQALGPRDEVCGIVVPLSVARGLFNGAVRWWVGSKGIR